VSPELIQWVSAWSRKGDLQAKMPWEQFLKEFVPNRSTTSKSTIQTNESIFHQSEPAKQISSVVIWNGNGVRARWNSQKNELKQVVHAANPDLLFFLESKTNAEQMIKLKGFEEWVISAKFCFMSCYWSERQDKKAYGNEGILILSKIQPQKVVYGMGDEVVDEQARVVVAEFENVMLLVTYNPQKNPWAFVKHGKPNLKHI